MSNLTKFSTFISLLISTYSLNISSPVIGKPVVYDFTVNVTEGGLKGRSFTGTFSYDDDKLTDATTQTLTIQDGLKVCMNFMSETQDQTKDVDYPEFPQLTLKNRQPETLDFWVETQAPRRLWWNQNGWLVEISPRQDNNLLISCQ